jgi:hypothetical protein
MKNFKQHDVVMIATDKASILSKDRYGHLYLGNYPNNEIFNQHLYIKSDDVIKEGDWYLMWLINKYELMQCRDEHKADRCNNHPAIKNNCKKIIATTDSSLKECINKCINDWATDEDNTYILLSQIPQSFIEHYITEYNKGNVITKVMIEYEEYDVLNERDADGYPIQNYKLLINPDNTINIKPIKDSFSREEFLKLLEDYRSYAWKNGLSLIDKNKWINENL